MGALAERVLGAWLWCSTPAPVPPPVPLPEVTVPAPEEESLPSSAQRRDVTGVRSTVERKRHAGAVKDASEWLQTTPGVVVQDRGGAGQSKTVSIRGASPNGVLVLLDGMVLSQSGTNIDLSRLPTVLVERMEIVRGGAGARYGSGGLGGVVQVFTRRPSKEPRLFAELSLGSFESWAGNTGFSTKALGGEGLVLLYGSGSRGNFRFLYDDTPLWDQSPGRIETRTNNDSTQGGFLSKYRTSLGKLDFSMMAEGLWDARGLSGTVQNPTPDARQQSNRLSAVARVEEKAWNAQLWGRREGLRLQGGLFGSPGEQLDEGVGAEWNGEWLVGEAHGLSATVQAAFESVRQAQGEVPASAWLRGGAMVGEEFWLLEGTLALLGSLRLDAAGPFVQASPKGGLLWQLPHALEVRANAGRAHRLPSFLELYVRQGQLLPNRELLPEAAWTVDAQVARNVDAFSWSVGGFYSSYENLISYEYYPPLLARPFNFASAEVAGVELEGRWTPAALVEASMAYTFLSSKNRTPDARYVSKALPFRPQHKVHANVKAGPSWLSGRAEVFFQSEQFTNRTETLSLPARAFVNVGLSSEFLSRPPMALSLEVKNVFDVFAQDLDGYPLPSRGVYLTWTVGMEPRQDK